MYPLFAVIGKPIDHSLSPFIHQSFAAQTGGSIDYVKIEGDEQYFERQALDFFAKKGRGLNVTLPFKTRACYLAQHRTPRCEQAQAANTLWFKNEEVYADNTDGEGLIIDLTRYLTLSGLRVLILGAGGATRGIIQPLLNQGITSLTIANRSHTRLQHLLRDFQGVSGCSLNDLQGNFDLIIHATSATYHHETLELSPHLWANQPFCYDLSYSLNKPTPFIAQAQSQGCPAQDGLGMLVEQAAVAYEIWHGVHPETKPVLMTLRNISK